MRLIILCILASLFIISFADIINVPEDQATIQEGISSSADGDTVLVQPGIYPENINLSGKNILLTSLYFTTQDSSYISGTIIDGNQAGSVVTINSGESSDAVLSGFTITNGYTAEGGAGIYINNSSPRLEYLIVTNNTSCLSGGGLFCYQSTSALIDSRIIGNTAEGSGGGIATAQSTFNLENSLLAENQADGFGGGAIFNGQSYLYINNCIIRENFADGYGGAIHSDSQYYTEVTDSEICYNSATINGGGYSSYGCDAMFDKVVFHHNSANRGGAIFNSVSDLVVLNCTIADNQALDIGSAIGAGSGFLALLNCIVYGHPDISWLYYDGGVQAAYCDIEDYEQFSFIEPLENVIDEDPLFMEHPESDYYLRESSPCHDTGIDSFYFSYYNFEVQLEIDEFMGNMPDMGAYEYYEANENDDNYIVPASTGLCCYPNPFNPETNLLFRIDEPQSIDLKIYNLKGQLINTLYAGILPAGEHQFTWNGKNRQDRVVSSGMYLAIMKTDSQQIVTKLVLLK